MDVDGKELKLVLEVGQIIRRLIYLIYICILLFGEVREIIVKDLMMFLQILKCRFLFISNMFCFLNLNKVICLVVELEIYNWLEKQILIQILEVFLWVLSVEDVILILKLEVSEIKMNEVY